MSSPHETKHDSYASDEAEGGASSPLRNSPSATDVASRASLKILLRNGGLLLGVLWIVAMWLFGTNYGAEERVHNLKVSVLR